MEQTLRTKMKSIWAHCLVKNEARFLWYSVSSIIDYVDKILLWDTGSTDESVEIEKDLLKKYPDKVILKNYKQDTAEEFTLVRQKMLLETTSDWFIVLDADEIWWRSSINKVIEEIQKNGDSIESIVVPTINLVGDIYHYQEEAGGKYRIAGKTGHYNLRAIKRNIPGLHATGPHGQMGWVDGYGKMIQDRGEAKVKFINAPYLHSTFLQRAGGEQDKEVVKRLKKRKYEIGINFPKDFYYPESLFFSRPDYIQSPWRTMNLNFKIKANIETPLKKIKRRIWRGGVGY